MKGFDEKAYEKFFKERFEGVFGKVSKIFPEWLQECLIAFQTVI